MASAWSPPERSSTFSLTCGIESGKTRQRRQRLLLLLLQFQGALPHPHLSHGIIALEAHELPFLLPLTGVKIRAPELLSEIFYPFRIPTTGTGPHTGRQLIDHVAHSRHFTVNSIRGWGGRIEDRKMSDHSGVLLDLGVAR